MLSHDEIVKIKNEIKTSIENQVKEGAQSKNLSDALACGQFIKVLHLKQRGIHGTSAAIRVLASYNGAFNIEIGKLIKYVQERRELEKGMYPEKNIERDEINVIKIGELLYSLSFVKQGCIDTSSLVKELGTKLLSNKKNDESWGYFTDSKDQSELLPTAFAYLGLRSNNFSNLHKIEEFLKSSIINAIKSNNIDNPSLFASLIAALYILSIYDIDVNQKHWIKELWKSSFCTMYFNVEQNIEYPYDYEHSYVRIPWQLYFLALAAKYSPRYFTKRLCRQRIHDIDLMVKNKGFKYIQSGDELSTRTNSILFDVIEFIDKNSKKNFYYYFFSIFNEINWFINLKWLRRTLLLIILLGIGFSIFKWIKSPNTFFEDLAPEFIGYFIAILIMFSKR
jgi:hypothetical protein